MKTDSQPRVGVGCIVMRGGETLLVQSRREGQWSSPGGNLDFGESPTDCALRETAEEAGVTLAAVEFLAVTNDVMPERGTHYITIWMVGEADTGEISIADEQEIADAGWFPLDSLPEPKHPYFENLLQGGHLQTSTENPFASSQGLGSGWPDRRDNLGNIR
jgi:8-oxo-dGTP diphosphatase